jgi:UDP-glucuronate 4-epimerase
MISQKFLPQDLLKRSDLPVDAIIHLAAKAGVRPSILNPLAYQQANVIGLQNLLDFAKETKCKQFVFASSSSVYGINDHFPWKEDEQLMPISPYAMTKLAGEMLGHVYSKLFDIRFLGTALFYGLWTGATTGSCDTQVHKGDPWQQANRHVRLMEQPAETIHMLMTLVQGIIGAIKYDKTNFEVINLGNNYSGFAKRTNNFN